MLPILGGLAVLGATYWLIKKIGKAGKPRCTCGSTDTARRAMIFPYDKKNYIDEYICMKCGKRFRICYPNPLAEEDRWS